LEVVDSGGKILQQQQQKNVKKIASSIHRGDREETSLSQLGGTCFVTSTNYGIYRYMNLKTVVWNRTRNCRMVSECDNPWSAEYCAS